MVLAPVRRDVHHPYSDRPAAGISVTTYSFEELFTEKVRALAERLRPRDLYDVVHLYRRQEIEPDRRSVEATLRAKCAFKGIQVPTIASIRESPLVGELQAEWSRMLGHQLPELPPFDAFWNELPEVFTWLFEARTRAALPSLAIAAAGRLDSTWRPPAMAASWRSFGTSAPLEVVRFAAANRLCIELDYRDEAGKRSTRLIEPYALRRSSEGNLLLLAVKAGTGESRSYRADRIVSATATTRAFTPRFAIELSRGESMVAADLVSPPVAARLHQTMGNATRRRALSARTSAGGPRYVFRCSLCGKIFRRSTRDGSLNPHKGKNGRPSPGSVGIYVKTVY